MIIATGVTVPTPCPPVGRAKKALRPASSTATHGAMHVRPDHIGGQLSRYYRGPSHPGTGEGIDKPSSTGGPDRPRGSQGYCPRGDRWNSSHPADRVAGDL